MAGKQTKPFASFRSEAAVGASQAAQPGQLGGASQPPALLPAQATTFVLLFSALQQPDCALPHTEAKPQLQLALCQVLTCLYSLYNQKGTSNPRQSPTLLHKVMQDRRVDPDLNCSYL